MNPLAIMTPHSPRRLHSQNRRDHRVDDAGGLLSFADWYKFVEIVIEFLGIRAVMTVDFDSAKVVKNSNRLNISNSICERDAMIVV
jgi:hypothetical protein